MFSQNQEEEIILKYFGDFKGTFLSLGENDGVTLSNVRALALNDWRGVLVEPSPKAFSRLEQNYLELKSKGQFYLYQYAIGEHNGNFDLYESGELLKKGDVGLVSTFNQSEMDRFKSVLNYEPVKVKMFRWKTFLNRLSIKEFDFISIDCEGNDEGILRQMDFESLKAKCLCVEWNSRPELHKAYSEILNNFRIIYTSAENLIFVK